ncbi:hypothetical protein WJX84_000368 [Apatococcus fuscideae]|uniref:Uncharacterized protein n=1 Tax=Apatococcus fuscideae TaxID=2026836 RepID=A0AAW1RT63_9CHLO
MDDRLLAGMAKRKQSDFYEDEGEDVGEGPATPRGLPGEGHSRSNQDLLEEEAEEQNAQLTTQDQLVHSCRCQLVTPKHVVQGMLRITHSQLQFTGDAQQEGPGPPQPKAARTQKAWRVQLLAELQFTRYQLRPHALEIFFSDHTNALLSFLNAQDTREVATSLQRAAPQLHLLDRKRKLEQVFRMQQRWQRWEISNFEYLMRLNTLAGRTYNDLSQYPVFPWVIADYTSEALDLSSPATFRDLSKPVGALDEKRLQFFLERFDTLTADPDSLPPFHYGSHYSSAGTVLFYLVRLEPFTAMNRALQGGHFDHADRLFHSIADTWNNVLHNSSDVKELIPEFYYHSEFLLNANNFDFGARQNGPDLADVVLPPWAKGSPEEFVRIQREALESDFVSDHLHEWIDLIFGFKQRGKAAEDAANVFFYLTYEGAVDMDSIPDAHQRKAVEDQISNFGQTPSQVFRKKHPRRSPPPSPAARPLLNGPDAMKLTTVGMPPAKRPNIAVARLEVADGKIVLVNADRAVSCHKWIAPRPDSTFTFAKAGELAYGVEADSTAPRLLGTPFAADLESGHCYTTMPGAKLVASCGYWDNSVRCYSVEDGRMLQSLRQHKDIVTCIAVGADGETLVTGSRDTLVIIWDIAGPKQKGGRNKAGGQTSLPLQDQPRYILYGHQDSVICLAVCTQLDLVVSAAADGNLLFHTLSNGRYIRCLSLPEAVVPALLAAAAGQGMLVAHSWQDLSLHAYTINGRHLVSAEGNERLKAMVVSPDGRFLLTGGCKGFITLRWLHSMEVVLKYDAGRGPITALAVTAEDCILAGTQDGCMMVFAPDSRRHITRRLNLADARSTSITKLNSLSNKVVRFE